MDKDSAFIYFIIILMVFASGYMYFDKSDFELKCVVSTVDGNKYCVRESAKVSEYADLLARATGKCKQLVKYVGDKYKSRSDDHITVHVHVLIRVVRRLVRINFLFKNNK